MDDLFARDLMARDVVTVRPEATLREIIGLLVVNQISGAPVVEADGTVIGVVSETDLIAAEQRRAHEPDLSPPALLGISTFTDEALTQMAEGAAQLTARELMSQPPFTLREDTPAREIAAAIVDRKISRVPIVRDGKLVGLVTRSDLVRAIPTHWRKPE
jgi:CBS domain-containing protein